ncbi:MAG: zinc ABC transporter substrate-binding protein [Gammaproteobacteria bacterium]|nr:MAG: zinc ABC transporter substrate-binding protein [Gammaproteobacteria bacterium]
MKSRLWLFIGFIAAIWVPRAEADLRVFACEPFYQALLKEIGGEQVHVYLATTALQDPHRIQARPSLISQVRRADMIACHGAELEIGWLPLLLRRANNPNLYPGRPGHFIGTDFVKKLGVPTKIDRALGDIHAEGNPHIQTGPQNVIPVANALVQRLIELDPSNRSSYERRHQQFVARWQQRLDKWRTEIKALKGMPVVVYHDSWVYLEAFTGIKKVATIEDKPGIPPTSGHLANLLHQLEKNPAKAILYAAYQNPKAAQWLAEKIKIPLVKLPFTIGGTEDADSLEHLYEVTFQRLLERVKP